MRHIVFDIGRVLIHWDREIPYRRLIPDPAERRWFLDHVCTQEWNLEQDRGRSWADAEAELVAVYPQHEANIRAFRERWTEMVSHAYEGSVAVLRELLRQGHDVTLLTNFNAETYEEARRLYPFLDEPRGVTVSGRIGLVKPDRAIYAHHCRSFGLEPSGCLFFDDSSANVEGARAAGWSAELYTGEEKLRADLKQHGVW